ncbi:hypothetical protein ACTFIR_001934 [Dictyostelium discoideum]
MFDLLITIVKCIILCDINMYFTIEPAILFDKFQANLVGAIMEVIWSRRNSLKFDFKDKAITFKMAIYILSKARDADWDRTIKTIEHLRRLELKNHQLGHTWKIMKKL